MSEVDVSRVSKGVPGRRSLHAHKAVEAQAREICLALYEETMRVNEIRKQWKARFPPGTSERQLRAAFLARYLFRCVPTARGLMAARLRAAIDPAEKDALYEALTLDATLMRGRRRPLG